MDSNGRYYCAEFYLSNRRQINYAHPLKT